MHLNPSLKDKHEAIQNYRKTKLKKIDNKKFISNRRLLLIDRINDFRECAKNDKQYAVLNINEQDVMTGNIKKLLKHTYEVALEQKQNIAASKIQAFIRKR